MNIFKAKFLCLIITISIVFFSCTPLKKLKYLQNSAPLTDTIKSVNELYRLQKGDNIFIDIASSNAELLQYVTSQKNDKSVNYSGPTSLSIFSYQVDDQGMIIFPLIQPINALNKTLEEVRLEIQQNLSVYLTDVAVSIKLVNFNITVIGEVVKPGQYYSLNNKVNLFEAIGMAGDLTVYGNRKKITVMRRLQDGNYQIHYLDITKSNVVSNIAFNLKPNDVVYVEPLRTKPFGLGAFPVATILSTITTFILIVKLFN